VEGLATQIRIVTHYFRPPGIEYLSVKLLIQLDWNHNCVFAPQEPWQESTGSYRFTRPCSRQVQKRCKQVVNCRT